jgi:membrane protease YdiL (CAAX protease family)
MSAVRNAIWIAAAVILVEIGLNAGLSQPPGSLRFWLYIGAPTFALAIAGLVRAVRDGELGAWLMPKWGDATRGVLTAFAMLAVAWAVSRFLVGTPREAWLARAYLAIGDPGKLRAHGGMVAGVIILFAIGEEIVWRGLVTTVVAEKLGSRTAWLYAAVLYAVAHVPTMWSLRDDSAGLNPLIPLAALFCGIAWGALVRATGRLAPAVISHALFDWAVVMMFRLWGNSV